MHRVICSLIAVGVMATVGAGCSGSAGQDGPTRLEAFRVAPLWGEAPLEAKLSWRLAGRAGEGVTCAVDFEGDGKTDITVEACPAEGEVPFVYQARGRYSPTITVDGMEHQPLTLSSRVYANGIRYADQVVFPEKLSGFVDAVVAGDSVTLKYAERAPEIAAGAILWGTSHEGYLRRVVQVSASGATLVLQTQPAQLTEAIVEGFFGMRDYPISLRGATCAEGCAGVTMEHNEDIESGDTAGRSSSGLSASGQRLSLDVHIPDLTIKSVVAWREMGFSMSLTLVDFVVDISPFGLRELKLELQPQVDIGGRIEVSPIPIARAFPLGRFPLGAIPLGPFVLVPETDPEVKLQLQSNGVVEVDASASFSVMGGVYFKDGKPSVDCKPVFEPHLKGLTTKVIPTVANSTLQLKLHPKLSTRLFGVAGPYVAPGGFVKSRFSTPTDKGLCMTSSAGLAVNVGADVSVPLIGGLDVSHAFTLAEWPLAELCGPVQGASQPADAGVAPLADARAQPPLDTRVQPGADLPAGCSCAGKQCGTDGCGKSCGSCSTGKSCNAAGQCVSTCVPQCDLRCPGVPDKCGGLCTTSNSYCPGCCQGTTCYFSTSNTLCGKAPYGACVDCAALGKVCSAGVCQ